MQLFTDSMTRGLGRAVIAFYRVRERRVREYLCRLMIGQKGHVGEGRDITG